MHLVRPEQPQLSPQAEAIGPLALPEHMVLVQRWIEQTQGWQCIRASHTDGRSYSADAILLVAGHCEWAMLSDLSSLPDVQQGRMLPLGLELGWGDRRTAYRDPKSQTAKVYFFNAYRA